MNDEISEIKAVPSSIFEGDERKISVLCIQIKEIRENDKGKLLREIEKNLYLNHSILGSSQEGTFLALFNVIQKQENHELIAVKTALAIQNDTKNIKSLKIGLGVNSGKAIVSNVENSIVKYSCLGNLVNLTKKLSTKSENNVLFTQEVYDKISANLKADEIRELFDEFNIKVYSLSRVVDRKKYDSYVREFMNRMRI